MQTLQQKLRQVGLADFLDVNIPQSKLQTQIVLLKRLISQAKLSDIFDTNLTGSQLAKQLQDVAKYAKDIPVTFKTADLPVPPEIKDLVQNIKIAVDDQQALGDITSLKARMEALAGFLSTIKINADDTGLLKTVASLQAKLTTLASSMSNLKLDADATALVAKLTGLQAQEAKLADKLADIPVSANVAAMTARLAKVQAQATELAETLANLPANVNATKATARLAVLIAQEEDLRTRLADIPMNVDVAAMQTKLAALQAQIALISSKLENMHANISGSDLAAAIAQMKILESAADNLRIPIDMVISENTSPATADLISLQAKAKALATILTGMRVTADSSSATATIAKLQAQLAALTSKINDIKIGIDVEGFERAEAELIALRTAAGKFAGSVGEVDTAVARNTAYVGRWGLGLLTARVSLFAGAAAVSGWHLALDAVIETLAVVIPALVTAAAGLGAFAVAASDSARQVYSTVTAIHVVGDAFNATIPPMTGKLEALHDQVRPMVWELYGDAINVVHTKTGLFNQLALQTGSILDRLAARFTVLITKSGPGLTAFLTAGKRDLDQFGRIALSLGDALGKLIEITQKTHIAEYLLEIVGAAAKLFDMLTKLPIPLLAVVVGLHGLYLWGGLAVTGLSRLLDPLRAVALSMGGVAKANTELAASADATGFARLKAVTTDIGAGFVALSSRISGTCSVPERNLWLCGVSDCSRPRNAASVFCQNRACYGNYGAGESGVTGFYAWCRYEHRRQGSSRYGCRIRSHQCRARCYGGIRRGSYSRNIHSSRRYADTCCEYGRCCR